jgi:hypothetical protein
MAERAYVDSTTNVERIHVTPIDVSNEKGGSRRTAKRCTKCKVVKPLGAFCADRAKSDGLSCWCRPCRAARMAQRNRAYRLAIISHYSGGSMRCACCGEGELHFLAIDHIAGNGADHRREIGDGSSMYRWIVKNGFPSGFQVLCSNCNWAKSCYGMCPHKRTNTYETIYLTHGHRRI